MGFDGKTLIHPKTIAIANEIFAPSPEEIGWARKVMAVENLHVEEAQHLLTLAEATISLEGGLP